MINRGFACWVVLMCQGEVFSAQNKGFQCTRQRLLVCYTEVLVLEVHVLEGGYTVFTKLTVNQMWELRHSADPIFLVSYLQSLERAKVTECQYEDLLFAVLGQVTVCLQPPMQDLQRAGPGMTIGLNLQYAKCGVYSAFCLNRVLTCTYKATSWSFMVILLFFLGS